MASNSQGRSQARACESLGRYRFTHALTQETLLAELSTTRRVQDAAASTAARSSSR